MKNITQMTGRVLLGQGEVNICGKGAAEVSMSRDCGGRLVTFRDVLYVPDLELNLLSVSQLALKGLDVIFSERSAEVRYDGDLIFAATLENGLYCVRPRGDDQPSRAASARSTEADPALLHRRLGHVHYEAIQKIPNLKIGPVSDRVRRVCARENAASTTSQSE